MVKCPGASEEVAASVVKSGRWRDPNETLARRDRVFATEYLGEWPEVHGPTQDDLKDWRDNPVPFERIQRDIQGLAAEHDEPAVVITQTRVLPCSMKYIRLTVNLGDDVKIEADR